MSKSILITLMASVLIAVLSLPIGAQDVWHLHYLDLEGNTRTARRTVDDNGDIVISDSLEREIVRIELHDGRPKVVYVHDRPNSVIVYDGLDRPTARVDTLGDGMTISGYIGSSNKVRIGIGYRENRLQGVTLLERDGETPISVAGYRNGRLYCEQY